MSHAKDVPVFNAEVRHGGNILHSLVKERITDREIRVLRAIHGEDGVVNVKQVGTEKIDEQEELFRLGWFYRHPKSGYQIVEKALNVSLAGINEWRARREAEEDARRKERREESQKQAAMFSRAREAADAEVRLKIARDAAPA